jgi:hypothetical protein
MLFALFNSDRISGTNWDGTTYHSISSTPVLLWSSCCLRVVFCVVLCRSWFVLLSRFPFGHWSVDERLLLCIFNSFYSVKTCDLTIGFLFYGQLVLPILLLVFTGVDSFIWMCFCILFLFVCLRVKANLLTCTYWPFRHVIFMCGILSDCFVSLHPSSNLCW